MLQLFRNTLVTVCVASIVAGCVSYQPEPLDPSAELDSLRRIQAMPATVEHVPIGAASPSSTPAFDPADGLNEHEVVALALSLNSELRVLRLKIGESQAALISAGLWPNPELAVGWRQGIDGASGYTLDADFLFEFLRPGERQSRRDLAAARIDETRSEMLAAEHRLAADARQRLLSVLAAEQMLSLLDDELALRNRAAELVRQKRALGEATELDVAVASLESAELRRDRLRAHALLQSVRQELNRVLGLPPPYSLNLTDSGKPLHIAVYDEPLDEEIDRRLLAGRQELRAKQAAYSRAEQQLRLAILQQYPKLKLGPSFGTEPEGTNYLGLGASLELPLLDRAQGRIAEANAARQTARAEYVAMLHRLRADAFEARSQLHRARLELDEQQRDLLPLIQQNQDLLERAYRARELSLLDWMTAQQRMLKARRDYLESLVRYRKSIIDLEGATGMLLSQPSTKPTTQPAP